MQTITLPQGAAFYTTRVELEGSVFALSFAWNARAEMWFMSIATEDGATLAQGLGVASNRRLLRRHKHIAGMPAGDLMAADPTATVEAPGYDQLGTVVEFVYFTAAELEEAGVT